MIDDVSFKNHFFHRLHTGCLPSTEGEDPEGREADAEGEADGEGGEGGEGAEAEGDAEKKDEEGSMERGTKHEKQWV